MASERKDDGTSRADEIASTLPPGKLWTDPDFPPTMESIGDVENVTNPSWVRTEELVRASTGETRKLFSDGIAAGDVCQGGVGDCWFLGALAVVADRADLIRRVIAGTHEDKGVYSFRFYKFGEWHEIVIDDLIPAGPQGPLFATGKDPTETWVMLIEKAYAKLHSSYGAIVGGWTNDALVDTTGGVPDTIFLDEVEDDIRSGAFWDRIHAMQRSGKYLLGCAMSTSGKREADTGRGILQGHAYSILDTREHEGTRLFRIRNPWGCAEWTGPWSDKDPRWTTGLLDAMHYTIADDGTFWIAYEDFIREYNKVYVCHLIDSDWQKTSFKSAFSGANAGGCANHATWINNHQYQLVVYEPTDFVISIQQRDPRQTGKKGDHIGLVVLHAEADRKTTQYHSVHSTEISNLRELTLEERLEPGIYNLMPFTFEPGVEIDYFLTVYGSEAYQLKSLDGLAPFDGTTEPPAGRELPTPDPRRPAPSAPVAPPVIAKRTRSPDDPGIVGLLLGLISKQLGNRYPQLGGLLAAAGAGGGGAGGAADMMAMAKKGGCCTVM